MGAAGVVHLLFLLIGSLLLDSALLDALGHGTMYAVDAETGGQDGDLDFLTEFGVEGQTPFDFEIVVELLHEVVHVVHLVHHQSAVGVVAGEGDVEQNLFGVEHIVVVEQR